MRTARMSICAIVVMAVMAGVIVTISGPTPAVADQKTAPPGNHWRHHDNHWNYWDNTDKRWYYTDGSNWFYNQGGAWSVYGFDKNFGKDSFERGEYKVPGNGLKIESPRHGIYDPPMK